MKHMITKKRLFTFLFSVAALPLAAQSGLSLTARNDTLRTGPLQTVKKDVIMNDDIPDGLYTWQLTTALDPVTQGTVRVDDDFLTFVPGVACRNASFDLRYKLMCGGHESTATIHIQVSNYNHPVNVVDPDLRCVEEMPRGVDFKVHKKFQNTEILLDGFSMPLVGDINGDGKPDIIALGLGRTGAHTSGDDLGGRAWYVHVFDGQTGERTWSVNFGTEPAAGALGKVTSLGHEGITTALSEANDQFQLRFNPRHNSPGHLAIADLDGDGLGEIVVVECGNLGRMYALKPIVDANKQISGFTVFWDGNNGGRNYSYKTPVTGNHEVFGAGVPYIADLNGDGVPEVIVYNKIFNGRTGALVCTLETLNDFAFPTRTTVGTIERDYAYVGRRPGAAWKDEHIPCMAIADINKDGILDIVAGSKVYIMKDSGGKPALDYIIRGPWEISAQRGTGGGNVSTCVTDGFTAVADIDLDGNLDVIVLAPAIAGLATATNNLLYVWDPLKNPDRAKAAVYLHTESLSGTMSFPFVGDINGRNDDYSGTKQLPEICFNTGRFFTSHASASQIALHPLSATGLYDPIANATAQYGFNVTQNQYVRGHIVGFTYHADPYGGTPLHERLKLSWAMEHGDESSCTGITMFDFDNDNIKELCYRDENSVRVISPARKTYITNTETASSSGAIRFKESDIKSYTGFEAPVIADVDKDGSADIVTLVYPGTEANNRSKGHIYVFEHAPGYDKWAPCPSVWNQTIYFPLQIHENLTVPARPQSMLTSYTDGNGTTIYPYNGQWIQQPIVREGRNYVPVVRKPDAALLNMTIKVNSTTKATVTLTIRNRGSASVNAQTPVSFYNGDVTGKPIGGGAVHIATTVVGVDIFPDEKVTRTYTLTGDYTNKLVWARLVDNGYAFPATGYLECDLTNNTFSAIDCPSLVYTVTSPSNGILCDANPVVLTATPANPVQAPTYQWYRNELPLAGATAQTYQTASPGEYKCYVIDDICRGFSSAMTLTRVVQTAVDDYAVGMGSVPQSIDVLANDLIPPSCHPVPTITRQPANGTAAVAAENSGKILYTPNAGFSGNDSLQYSLDNAAIVRIALFDPPDDISSADCFTNPPATAWSIDDGKMVGDKTSSLYQSAVVGDLDGDGFSEIIVPKGRVNDSWLSGYYTNGLNVYDMKTSSMKAFTTAEFATSDLGPVGMAKAQATDKEALIVVSAKDGYLYAYNKAGAQQWKSDEKYTTLPAPANFSYVAGAVGFADFNGDGYAEIYIRDKIFDLKTGKLLLSLNNDKSIVPEMSSAVADFDNDGRLEMVIRDKVYRITITNRTGTSGNSATVWQTVDNGPYPNGGMMTILADFDLDGQLDVLVNDLDWFYVWSPYTGKVKAVQVKEAKYKGKGCPFVGDIDGDGYPEILYTGENHVTAWDIDGQATATVKWQLATSDVSGYTGITLFDFNQDGRNELVYRDETHLRIIDGSTDQTVKTNLAAFSCTSGTQGEYPVVADVDNDGQAEIIITGGGNERYPHTGHIRIFKAGAGQKWAPARKVWNQYAYNAVHVNNDLSIPKRPLNPAIVFPGKDGVMGTADDVRPYNAFLQQQTVLNRNGNPLWLVPNTAITPSPVYRYDAGGDSLCITATFTNAGSAALLAPFYVSVYKNTVDAANRMATGTYSYSVKAGETATVRLVVRNFSNFAPLNDIVVRVNDAGNARHDQPECSLAGSEQTRPAASLLRAHNDYGMFAGASVTIKVLDNDSVPAASLPLTAFDTLARSGPKHGTFTLHADRSLTYRPAANFYGIDSIDYSIASGADTGTARVYIVVNNPLASEYLACAGAKVGIGFAPVAEIEYDWYTSATGNAAVARGNTYDVVKNGDAVQSWWAEPRYRGRAFPRYRMDLLLSDNCGATQPTGCMVNGTLLFKEDFGGNEPSAPHTKTSGIAEVNNYTYSPTLNGHGVYCISKTSNNFHYRVWYKNIYDHTFPGDPSRGYLIGFDASNAAGQFYKHQIDGLCAGVKLYFSAWLASLVSQQGFNDKTNVQFLLEDLQGNTLARYYTGDVPDVDPAWKSYGFGFTIPEGQSSVVLKIINNGTGTSGNDFVMDDIEIRLCAPVVSIDSKTAADTTVCAGATFVLQGEYTDDGSFGNQLAYRWEQNTSGHLDVEADWRVVAGSEGSVTTGRVSAAHPLAPVAASDAGYYRLAVSTPQNIVAPKCKALSKVFHIGVLPAPAAPVIEPVAATCAGGEAVFRVPALYNGYEWRDGSSSGSVTGTTAYIVRKTTGVHTQVVRVQNEQGCWSPYSAPVTGDISALPSRTPVSLTSLSANYAATPPTVTFRIDWPAGAKDCRHLSDVWVFVDYRSAAGAGTNHWERALVNATPTLVSTDAGSSVTRVAGNNRGFWLHGVSGSYSATLTVPVTVSGSRFSWCAYAIDYPPNATEGNGVYNLHGTTPFVVNGTTLGAGVRTYTGCITSLTDATACPGLLPTAPQIVSLSADPPTIRSGESATLRAVATHAAAYSFDDGQTWRPGATLIVKPTATTTYKVKMKSLAGCVVEGSITVKVQ
jgi:hypothetical protein